MASSRREGRAAPGAIGLTLALVGGLLGCATGEGSGELRGELRATDCGELDEADWSLEPSYFSAEVTGDQLNIRMQRGSDLEGFADGLMIHVRDVNEVRQNRIGLPIALDPSSDSLVQVVVYLNETCKSGFPDEFRTRPLIIEASSGSVTFDSVYAPDIDAGATGIAAELDGLVFEDPEQPDERSARLSGFFSFFYQRGGPAQRFP